MSANTCRQACVGLSAAADDGDSSPPLAACFFYVHLTLFLFSFLCRDYDYDDDLSIFAVGGMVDQIRKNREKDASREDVAVMPRRNRPRRSKPSKIEDELQRALLGQRKIQLINPVLEEDMDIKIARTEDITRLNEHVRTLELQGTDV